MSLRFRSIERKPVRQLPGRLGEGEFRERIWMNPLQLHHYEHQDPN